MPLLNIRQLASAFHGELLEPGDSGYNAARQIWNASVNKHPALIARCSGVSDVIAAVNFARDNSLLTAIRGGGHNVGGRALCDEGIVIDLSRMRSVHVDPATSTVRIQGGATLGISTVKLTPSAWRSRQVWCRRPALRVSLWAVVSGG